VLINVPHTISLVCGYYHKYYEVHTLLCISTLFYKTNLSVEHEGHKQYGYHHLLALAQTIQHPHTIHLCGVMLPHIVRCTH
jgi:hypothetical protein